MEKTLSLLIEYSDALQKSGYLKQAKFVGLLVSKLMLDHEGACDRAIRVRDARVGMVLAGVGKKTGFGAPGSYGEIKYIHAKKDSYVVGVYAPQVEDHFELVLNPSDKVTVLSLTKPLQRKAIKLKAKTLLANLALELENHDLGPQLARLNYDLVI